MRCPFCKRDDSKVLDSRESAEGTVTRRRRECHGCRKRFTTYERVEELMPLVVKKDGRREPYDREKLISGLQKAVEKRPVSMDQLEALVAEVEARVVELGEKEVPSSVLGEEVMRRLRALDQVAYVRFASVYRSFRDIEEFMDELKGLLVARGAAARGSPGGRPEDGPAGRRRGVEARGDPRGRPRDRPHASQPRGGCGGGQGRADRRPRPPRARRRPPRRGP